MNTPIGRFIAKALAFFVAWYVLYELWLLPDGSLDRWLSLNIIATSGGLLQFSGFDVYTVNRIIGIGEAPGIKIVDGCNGIAAMGLFIGFIVAYPGDWKKRTAYMVTGLGVIYLTNIIRVMVLAVTQIYWPAFFDFTHDYSTTAIFYIVIFVLWMIWVNYSDAEFKDQSRKAGF